MRNRMALTIAGALDIGFGFFHFGLPTFMNWAQKLGKINSFDETMTRLDLVDKGVFYLLTYFIGYCLIVFGVMLITIARADEASQLSDIVVWSTALFWLARLIAQFAFFGFAIQSIFPWSLMFLVVLIIHLFTLRSSPMRQLSAQSQQ